jgi:fatty acid desaturase
MSPSPPRLDYSAFAGELDALRARLEAEIGVEAHRHLRRLALAGRLCTAVGYATAWLAPNPISAGLMALGMSARWTIVAHHTSHRALDRLPGVPKPQTSRGFARGWRRWLDWPDWLEPAAWDYEHNRLHHYHTGEAADPDLVEEQFRLMRESRAPRWLKWAVLAVVMMGWKFLYYAPNIFTLHRREEVRKAEQRPFDPTAAQFDVDLVRAWSPLHAEGRAFWARTVLPYLGLRLLVLPALFLPLGAEAALWVLVNSVLAELLTGLHTFVIVVPNHAGEDLYRFDRPTTDRAEFYVRQVLSSTNFRTGGAVNDFLHGYLNYQVEHHLWPDASPLLYERAAPEVRAICARHGVPYVQEGVFQRFLKMSAIAMGTATMREGRTVPKAERRAGAETAEAVAAG